MLRIGIITATYPPSINGVAISTHLIALGLRQLGHEVRVFVPANPKAADTEEGVYRLPSTRLGAPRDYPVMLPPTARLSSRLPLHDLDIIHTMHPFIAGYTAVAWARRLMVPVAFTAHTQYHNYAHYAPLPYTLTQQLIRNHVRRFAQRVDAVMAPGTAMVEALRSYGYHGQVTITPNPVDLSRFERLQSDQVRAAHSVPEGAPLLLYVGRLAAEKNLPLLLDAYRRICAERSDAHLMIVGDGPNRALLQRRAAGRNVTFVGALSHDEVPPYLAAADLFVSPSLTETGTPLSFLEAFAAGTPVVSVVTGTATNDLVIHGENGLTCPPTADDLAESIASLLGSRERLALLARGARASARAYSVKARARALERIYRALIRDRAVRHRSPQTLSASSGRN